MFTGTDLSVLCFQVKEAVKHALGVGYRHIDCATAYSNEAEIGYCLQEVVGADKVKRNSNKYGCS